MSAIWRLLACLLLAASRIACFTLHCPVLAVPLCADTGPPG
jgi:hypothetical protein